MSMDNWNEGDTLYLCQVDGSSTSISDAKIEKIDDEWRVTITGGYPLPAYAVHGAGWRDTPEGAVAAKARDQLGEYSRLVDRLVILRGESETLRGTWVNML